MTLRDSAWGYVRQREVYAEPVFGVLRRTWAGPRSSYSSLFRGGLCLAVFLQVIINSTITPNMTFTKTSQKFGQWADSRASAVFGLGFSSELQLTKVLAPPWMSTYHISGAQGPK